MAIVSPGQKLPSVYLERFQPAENVVYRLSVLDIRAIATESHFLDIPSKDIKGVYQCIQGPCCSAFGKRRQAYNVPVYVYLDPARSADGEVQVWQMTAPQWKKFSDLALQVDLGVYDLMLTAAKRGYGMDLSYSVVPDVKMRDYWSAEQKEQLDISTASFYQLGESSLVNPMVLNDWNSLLYGLGYDLQNMCWPGGMSPMNSGAAFGAVRGGLGAPPPAPRPVLGPARGGMPTSPMGALPAAPGAFTGAPGAVFGVASGVTGAAALAALAATAGPVFQPPKPVPGVIPAGVAPAVPGAPAITGTGGVVTGRPAMTASVGPATVTSGVSLGVAPVVGSAVPVTQAVPASLVPGPAVQSVPGNEVPMAQEMTAEEMDQLLS